MDLVNINGKSFRKCAFCRHWYDPTNAAIRPRAPRIGPWEYAPHMKSRCLITNAELPAFHFCGKYECKV